MQINLAATFVIGISVYLEVFAGVYINGSYSKWVCKRISIIDECGKAVP